MGTEPQASATTFGAPAGPASGAGDPSEQDEGESDGSESGSGGSDGASETDGGASDPDDPDAPDAPDDPGDDDDPGNGLPATECGDGLKNGNEECDDGNGVQTDACKNDCTLNVCGDGIVYPGLELCDDGNLINGDACTNTCTVTSCGDGVVQAGEACDDGNALENDACLSTCVAANCGDGFVQAGVEACDDANGAEDDDCIACVAASCGDGFVHANDEDCDPGVSGSAGCSASCSIETVQFSYGFPFAAPDNASCTAWQGFRGALSNNHTMVHMSGTGSPAGRTCTGAGATTICNALRNGSPATVACDGHTWHVGACGNVNAFELTVDGSACACQLNGFAVRPCHGTSSFGGLQTNTCYAGAQTIDVVCTWE